MQSPIICGKISGDIGAKIADIGPIIWAIVSQISGQISADNR